MPNTEKPQTIAQEKKTKSVETPKKVQVPKEMTKEQKEKIEKQKAKSQETKPKEKKTETKKEEVKKPVQTKPKVKKDYAIVNIKSLPISTKYSIAICRFINGKTIEKAISDLEPVLVKKKAVPMKGEIPHRKGKIMSGRYPKKAVEHFIKMLKSLNANAIINEIDEPVIVEAIANLAQRPYGRFGRTRKKRTHVTIKCVNKKLNKKRGKKK